MYAQPVEGHRLIRELVGISPRFRGALVRDVESWLGVDGTVSVKLVFSLLASFVTDTLRASRHEDVEAVFEVVEAWLKRGDVAPILITASFLTPLKANDEGALGDYVWKLGPITFDLLKKLPK